MITVASEPDYPPYCMIDENGNAVGFSIDLFNAALAAVGMKAQIKIGIWSKIKQDLAEGHIDALPLVGRTPERESEYDFTLPYISLHGAIFVRKGTTGIESISDLKHKEIIVMKGDNAEEFIYRESISEIVITTNTFHEAFQKLANGEHDAVLTQRITGIKLLEDLGIKSVIPLNITIPEYRQDFCFAVKKGNSALLAKLNEGLSIIIADRTYDEIQLKWFGPPVKEPLIFRDYLKIAGYFLIPLLILFALFHIILLRTEVRNRTQKLNDEISNHKETYITLQDQKNLLNEMEKISKVGGWEFEVNSSLFTITQGGYSIFEISQETYEPIDTTRIFSFFVPDDSQILKAAFYNALEKGEPFELELKMNTPKERYKWVRIIGDAKLYNAKLSRLTGGLLDVTERKKAEQLVKASEEQFLLLLNTTADGIFGLDTNGSCIFCNKAALEMLGYADASQLIGKRMHNIIHPDELRGSLHHTNDPCPILNTLVSGKGVHVVNDVFIRADKSHFQVEYWSHPVFENNILTGVVVNFHDISSQIKMISELRETKDYLENLLHSANAPIVVWNNKFKIERFNEAFGILTGRSEKNVIGEDLGILFNPDKKDEYLPLLKRTSSGEKLKSIEMEIQHKDGNIKTVLWNSANIMNAEGNEIVATIAQGQDITERKIAEISLLELAQNLEEKVADRTKELEIKVAELDRSQKAMLYMVEDLNNVTAELEKQKRKLELSNKELEAFSYSVSHDLRAPLRAIDGFSGFLIEDYHDKLDEEGNRLLKVIKESAIRMDRLISDLINLSRIARVDMKYSVLEMEPVILAMYHEIATVEEKQGFTLKIGDMPTVQCDSTLIKQVWQNLLSNALKYSSKAENKTIVISSTENKNMFVFCIKDQGAGFDPKYSDKLFKVFQRLHRDTDYPGTGIGLSIVQRIIYRHGGEVWAKGETDKGASFFFSLPKI